MSSLYLDSLDDSLAQGLGGLSGAFVAAQLAFVTGRQCADGGYPPRHGDSDLYYTDFGVRVVSLLGKVDRSQSDLEGKGRDTTADRAGTGVDAPSQKAPHPALSPEYRGEGEERGIVAERALIAAGGYLANRPAPANIIDCFGLLNIQRLLDQHHIRMELPLEVIRQTIMAHHLPSGGFAHGAGQKTVSAYNTFLATLCFEMLGDDQPWPADTAEALGALACRDGGYGELPGQAQSQTNATAAVLATRSILGQLDHASLMRACGFLRSMQAAEGGIKAHNNAAGTDLLSTFTALLSLSTLDQIGDLDMAGIGRFVRICSRDGGFAAYAADNQADIEYTYYGLGTLALLRLWQSNNLADGRA